MSVKTRERLPEQDNKLANAEFRSLSYKANVREISGRQFRHLLIAKKTRCSLRKPLNQKTRIEFAQKSHQDYHPETFVDKSTIRTHPKKADLEEHFSGSYPSIKNDDLLSRDPNILAESAIATGKADDINLLIKKLTLSFSACKNHANFSIDSGTFKGTEFALFSDNHDLTLKVSNASSRAKTLLVENEVVLRTLLAQKEINLRDLRFLS